MANTHSFANFQGFVDANIKKFVRTDEGATRFVTRLWNDFEATTDGFDELIAIISDGKPIHSASDGSVLSDGRASAGWLFWRLALECDMILDATRYITTMQQNQTNAVNNNNNIEMDQLSRVPHDEEPPD